MINKEGIIIKSFLSWRGNQLSFHDSKWLFYLVFAIFILATLLIWIFKEKIYFKANNSKNFYVFIRISGIIALIILIARIIVLFAEDYPWKWELIPLHLCRMFLFIIATLFAMNKLYLVKYFSIFAFIGAILGIMFANIGGSKEFILEDRQYNNFIEGSYNWNNAGYNWGMDNIFFWDFVLGHSIIIFSVILMHVISGHKSIINLTILNRAFLLMISIGIVLFFTSWALYTALKNSDLRTFTSWNANWFYVGRVGISTLGRFGKWPFNFLSLLIVFAITSYSIFFIYSLLRIIQFDFKKTQNLRYQKLDGQIEEEKYRNENFIKFKNYRKTFKLSQFPKGNFWNIRDYK